MTAPNRPPVRTATLTSTVTSPSLEQHPTINEKMETIPPRTENTYPCGCIYPGQHKANCMWSLWEEMQNNYLQTKELMNKFMSQTKNIESESLGTTKCGCPPECHGQDLAGALGLQVLSGVTMPWKHQQPDKSGRSGFPLDSDTKRLIEEQRRIKNTWAQFLNIFDMALDLANDVSKDRWESNKRRKEQARLEREQRLEEQQQACRERGSVPKERIAEQKPIKKATEKKKLENSLINNESSPTTKKSIKQKNIVEENTSPEEREMSPPEESEAVNEPIDEAVNEPIEEPVNESDETPPAQDES